MTDEVPIYMLNALWFQPDNGRKRYHEYLRAVAPLVQKYGGKKLSSYVPDAALIGELDADLVFLVEWPHQRAFDSFLHDPDFPRVRELREAAITKSLLIRCHRED